MGLFNEDRLSHPHIPHVFFLPRLMNHLWINQLSKEEDVVFTNNVGPSFCSYSMHEPLIVLIIFPMAYVSNYRGLWVLRGSSPALEVQDHLEARFKHPENHGCRKFHDLEGHVHGVRDPKEDWIRDLLFKFLDAKKTSPPVL